MARSLLTFNQAKLRRISLSLLSASVFTQACSATLAAENIFTTPVGNRQSNQKLVLAQAMPGSAPTIASLTASAMAPLTSHYETTNLADAVKTGKIALELKGDGFSTTKMRLFLTSKADAPLRVVIPANQLISPKSLGTQTIMLREDKLAFVQPGKQVEFEIKTLCASVKTIKPPTSETTECSIAEYDQKDWLKLACINTATTEMEKKGAYKNVKIKADTKVNEIAQLSIWRALGAESGNPADQVDSKSIETDMLNKIKESAGKDANTLKILMQGGGTVDAKNQFVPSAGQVKAVAALSDSIFEAIDLTVKAADDPAIIAVTHLPKTPWDTYYFVGMRAFSNGEFLEAGEILEAAVKEAETHGEADSHLSQSLVGMAECFTDAGNYEGASPLLDRALKLRQKTAGDKSADVAQVKKDIGVLHQRQAEYDLATGFLADAYAIASGAPGNTKALVAEILDDLGLNYCLLGQGDKAIDNLQKALAVTLADSKGEQTAEVADINANLAWAYSLVGDQGKAKDLYGKALKVGGDALGNDNPFVANIMDGLARVMAAQNQTDGAKSLMQEAQSLREKGIGKENADRICALPARFDALTRMKLYCQGQKEIFANQQDLLTAGEMVHVAPTREHVVRPIKDKWSVVIGISNFKDNSINLKYSKKDAEDFANYLTHEANFAPDHVHVLYNENATLENIKSEIGDKFLPRVVNPDDLVVVYLSSHGSSSKVDIGGANFFVAYNTDKNNLYATGLDMADLSSMLKKRVRSDRVLVVLDACHSGAIPLPGAKGLFRVSNFSAEEIAQGSGQLVICSSDPSQVSWESKRYPNGVFTHCLIESLKKNGSSTKLHDAYSTLKDEVNSEVQRDRGEQQQPVLKSTWDGDDLVLATKAAQARAGMPQSFGLAPAQTQAPQPVAATKSVFVKKPSTVASKAPAQSSAKGSAKAGTALSH